MARMARIDWSTTLVGERSNAELSAMLGVSKATIAMARVRLAEGRIKATQTCVSFPRNPFGICQDDYCEVDEIHPAHVVPMTSIEVREFQHGDTLNDIVYSHVHTRRVKLFSEIYDDVVDDYGSVLIRTVWRALAALRNAERITKICPPNYAKLGAYVRVDEKLKTNMPFLVAQVEELYDRYAI